MSKAAEIFTPQFSCITKDLPGSEGPVFSKDEQLFMVAPEIEEEGKPAGKIFKIDLENGTSEVFSTPRVGEYGGIPAGCQADNDGYLWVADMRLGLLHIAPDGRCRQICKRDFSFNTMQGCNDCAMDYRRNLWITAPAGPIAPAAYTRSMEEPFGSVYCWTNEGKMNRVDTGYKFCNGIAVQHTAKNEPQNLIVAETPTKTLWCLPITGDGSVDVSKKSTFGHCPGHHKGGPDGMDFDCEGNLLVANWGSGFIEVFNQFGGRPHTRIQLPFKKVSNLHFRPNSRQVFVTEHDQHGLWMFEWVREGARQFCELQSLP